MKRKKYRKKYYILVTIVLAFFLLPKLIYLIEDKKFAKDLATSKLAWQELGKDEQDEKKGKILAYNDGLISEKKDLDQTYEKIQEDEAYQASLIIPILDWTMPIKTGEAYGMVHEKGSSFPIEGLVRSKLSYRSKLYSLLPVNRLDSLRVNDRVYVEAFGQSLAYQVVEKLDEKAPIESNELIIVNGNKPIYLKKTSYNIKVMEYDGELGNIYKKRKLKQYGLLVVLIYSLPLIFRREEYIEAKEAYWKKIKEQESRKNT